MNVYYNNKVLSDCEREEFKIMSEETIREFSESKKGFMNFPKFFNRPQIQNMTK